MCIFHSYIDLPGALFALFAQMIKQTVYQYCCVFDKCFIFYPDQRLDLDYVFTGIPICSFNRLQISTVNKYDTIQEV